MVSTASISRQDDAEAASDLQVHDCNFASAALNDLLAQRKSKAIALLLMRAVHLVESMKDPLLFSFRYSRSFVIYLKYIPTVGLF